MSGWLTTRPVKDAPTASAMVTLTAGALGAYGAWVQVIASAATDLAILGLSTDGGMLGDIQIGTGAAASEVAKATIKVMGNTAGSQSYVPIPVPMTGAILSGDRVVLRCRGTGMDAALLYYDSYDADNFTTATLRVEPDTAAGVSITPSGTAWVDTAWVQITAGISGVMSLYALAYTAGATAECEFDIATGGAGSETIVATMGTEGVSVSRTTLTLPALIVVAANTRIAARLRKAGTSVNNWSASILYYGDFNPASTGGLVNAVYVSP